MGAVVVAAGSTAVDRTTGARSFDGADDLKASIRMEFAKARIAISYGAGLC